MSAPIGHPDAGGRVKPLTVAVFEHRREGLKANGEPYTVHLMAYTTWYSESWKGCCRHVVEAANGTEAKTRAKAEHRTRCMTEAV